MSFEVPHLRTLYKMLGCAMIVLFIIAMAALMWALNSLGDDEIMAKQPQGVATVEKLSNYAARHWETHCRFPPALPPTATHEQACGLKSYTPDIKDPESVDYNDDFYNPLYHIYETEVEEVSSTERTFKVTAKLHSTCSAQGGLQARATVHGTKTESGRCTARVQGKSHSFTSKLLLFPGEKGESTTRDRPTRPKTKRRKSKRRKKKRSRTKRRRSTHNQH